MMIRRLYGGFWPQNQRLGPKFERTYRVEAKRLRTTLELIMGYRQVHEAPGLELYQDKIQLSQEGDSEAFEQDI